MIENPILPPHSADPWMLLHEGAYYYCQSAVGDRGIALRRASSIAAIGDADAKIIWTAPRHGMNSRSVWAPELHCIGGKWFIYYCADDGENDNHRMWVLESESDSPFGPYRCRGQIETYGWAIDGTPLVLDDGRMFLIWSGWPGRTNGQQNLYIAPMSNPWTVSGARVLIAAPTEPWERVAMPICEGPQVLRSNGNVFVVYSASGSWTEDYCLGLLTHRGEDLLEPTAWTKRGPVFQKTEQVWGLGHCSFVKSPCHSQDWIVYHAKSSRTHGWEDRDVHAKPFEWTPEGLPNFGAPLPRVRTLTKKPQSHAAEAHFQPQAL